MEAHDDRRDDQQPRHPALRGLAAAVLMAMCAGTSIPGMALASARAQSLSSPSSSSSHTPASSLKSPADLSLTQKPIWTSKPDVKAFESTVDAHLAAAARSVATLTAVKGGHTVDNTLRPFDDAVREINSAIYLASLMEAVHPDESFRNHASAMMRKASAAQTDLSLNHQAYAALAAMSLTGADAPTRYYVQRQLLEFRLSGVDKDEATRTRLKKLNDQLIEESSAFDRNINDDTRTIEVRDAAELAGLPQDYVEAHKPKNGIIRITTDYPDFNPVMTFAVSDDLRRRASLAINNRAYPKNKDVLMSMLQTRYDIATTLGYRSWADYNAADKMIKNAASIARFIQELDATVHPTADREAQMLLVEKRKTDPQASQIGNWERAYYSELVRRARYDFDSQAVRPYLPYAEVKQGILDTASKLFHVTFKREDNVPSWDPTVETWLTLDGDRVIGRFYLDMHPRAGKYSHAEMHQLLDGVEGKQLPEAVLICNFPRPTADDPGLMEYTDVQTFFHEFGHLMHMILGGHQAWAGISGIAMESDFAEAPSQMLEELIASPQVLAGFARHYKTGAPIPADLVQRMRRASAFGRGSMVALQNGYTAVSYEIYDKDPKQVDLDDISDRAAVRYAPYKPLSGTHMYASFTHLAGYSSAYYTYMWDKVIAEDFFEQFDPNNPLAGAAPMRYRRAVLEPGGSVSANDLVKNFLGRPQSMEALKRWVGQEFAGEH